MYKYAEMCFRASDYHMEPYMCIYIYMYILYIYIYIHMVLQNHPKYAKFNGQTTGLGYPNLEKHPPMTGELSGIVCESAFYHGLGPCRFNSDESI